MHLPLQLLFLKNKELDELFASMSLRSFAVSIIGIFIPIYLLQIGFSLVQVFLFFALLSIVHSISSLASIKVACKYGFKHSILFNTPLLIVFFLLLSVLETQIP
ncbi:MAG: hypothetical protein O2877_01585 [bacterium]|nr:hypothetical protein [bacterium]